MLLRQHQASTWITIPPTRTKKRKFKNIRPQLPEIEAPKAGQTEAVAAEIGGGRNTNFNGKNLPKNTTSLNIKKPTKDAEGFFNYLQTNDGKVALNHKNHPMCYYCG